MKLIRLLLAVAARCPLAFVIIGLGLAVAMASFRPAFAEAPALVSDTVVDFGPLISQVVMPTLLGVLGVVGVWLVAHLKTWLGIQNNAALAGIVDQALTNGLGFAQHTLGEKLKGPITLDVKNEVVAVAARYALDHVPDGLKMLGVDQASLIEKLQARLAVNTTPPESNLAVVTPPAAAK